MIKEYLEDRKKELLNVVFLNKEKYEHNQIVIDEGKNKIKELEDTEDVASKIFSVKTRKNSTHNLQEIREIESHIAELILEKEKLKKTYESAEKEIKKIDGCLLELENVSRETFSENNINNKQETSNSIEENVMNNSKSEESNVNKNVSRETLDELESSSNLCKENIVEKIELCKNLARIDGNRVYIELEKLLKKL